MRIKPIAIVAFLLLQFPEVLQASSGSWNVDASGSWITSGNWFGGSVPGSVSNSASPDTAYFTNTLTTATRTITVDTGRSISNLVLSPSSDSTTNLTLSGGSLWLASGGAITHSRTNDDKTDNISSPIRIKGNGGAASFIANGGQYTTFTVGGAISGESTGANVTTLTLGGSSVSATPARSQNGVLGVISDGTDGGKLAVVKAGAGVWTLQANNTFSGGVSLNQGTLRFFGNNANNFFGTGLLAIANGTTLSHANTGTNTIRNNILVNGNFTISTSPNLGFTGNLDLGGATRTITVSVVSNTTFSGLISNGGLTKAGTGALTLLGANTYNLGTTISAGTLLMGGAGVIPANAALTINGGALDMNGQDLTVSSLAGTGGSITNSGGILTVAQNTMTTNASVMVGNGSLVKSGNGTLTLSGASTFSGGVALNGGGLAVGRAETAGVSGPFGASGDISFNGGTLQYSAANAYDYSSRFSLAAGQAYSVDTAGQTVTFASNLISSGGNLTKLGTGTLTLSGTNTYGGGTVINDGIVKIMLPAAVGAGTVTVNGGVGGGSFAVWASGAMTLNNNFVLSSMGQNTNRGAINHDGGAGLMTLNGSVTLNGDSRIGVGGTSWNDMVINGQISGPGKLYVCEGAGHKATLTSSANNWSGGTEVEAGELNLAAGVKLGSGPVRVDAGGELSGAGIINGMVTVVADGTIQPGNGGTSIATLTISNNLVLSGRAVFTINRAGTPNTSKISCSGSVTYGGTLVVTNVGAAVQSGDSFQLFNAASRSGSFVTYILPLPGAGLTWNLNQLATSGTISVVGGSGVSYLDNGFLKVGIDLSLGGSITYLSYSGSTYNIINSHDWGRQVQQSYYSGPQPYDPYGNMHPSWPNWSWNPIQTGDVYGNRSRTIAYLNNGQTLYVQCRPMQWALNNVPGECTFESWITLSNGVANVSNRLLNMRTDTTEQFAGRNQELPAIYTIGQLYRLYSYDDMMPFTGGALTNFPVTPPPWVYWKSTECWAAMVDVNNWGLGVYHPGAVQFVGGFSGTPGSGGPNDSQTGYISPLYSEILDSNIEYTYRYHLILGTLTQIRNWVYAQSNRPSCDFQFKTERQHWTYPGTNTSDYGWPLSNGSLRVKLEVNNPYMVSPQCAFYATNAPKIYVRAAYHKPGSGTATAQLYWITNDVGGFNAGCSKTFTVTVDDQFHTYELNLATSTNYTGLITRLRFDPVNAGTNGDYVDLASISSTRYIEAIKTNFFYTVNGGSLTLNWPAAYQGCYLQSNSVSLANTNYWFDVPGSANTTNAICPLDSAPTSVFYRLRLP